MAKLSIELLKLIPKHEGDKPAGGKDESEEKDDPKDEGLRSTFDDLCEALGLEPKDPDAAMEAFESFCRQCADRY